MLELKNISKSFSGLQVLKNVNLELHQGEVLGLIGPNGAGKTTLFNMVSGLLKPDTGHILYDKKDITKMQVEDRVKILGIGRTFQIARPFMDLTCEENVLVGLQIFSISHQEKIDRAQQLLKKSPPL